MLANQERDQPATAPIPAALSLRFVPSLYQVAALAVLGAVFIVGLAPKIDTDLWWHLETGAYIVSHHAVPTHDFLSFSFTGHTWIDHEWASELLFYGLYRLAGVWGDIVFFAAVICATYCLVYANMQQRGVHPLLGLFVLTAAFISASETWGARSQMLTLLFLAAYALVLHRYEISRNGRLLWWLPALMVLWANLHGGWVLGLVFLGVNIAGGWLNRAAHHDDAYSAGELRSLVITFFGTLAVTAVNPNGIREVLYPLVWVYPTAWTNAINEWASADFHMAQIMVFEALLLTLIAAALIKRPRLNWTHLLLVLVFTHLALSQMRNVAVWSVLITPLVATYLQELIALKRRPPFKRVASVLNLAFLAVVVVLYLTEAVHYVNGTALRQNERAAYPTGAVAYLQTHALPPHLFNAYSWGGYVLWELYPRYQDFIDGRANTLFDVRILHDYLTAYTAAPQWKSVLRRYGVEDVLVPTSSPLAQVLAANRAWQLVYHDDVSVLYVAGSRGAPAAKTLP